MKLGIRLWMVFVSLLLIGCGRHYEVPINIYISLPDCNSEECLEALEKIDFSEMVHIEVDADVEKPMEFETDVTGGKVI